jgi:hypothetical protein
MITEGQYFGSKLGHPDATESRKLNAKDLLKKVNRLLAWAEDQGHPIAIDLDTGSQISGSKGGAGDGGFRLGSATAGAKRSAHKEGLAVDVYDPGDAIDLLLTDRILEDHTLWRESSAATPGWVHLQSVAPKSGRRTFTP